ncbi:MAG: TonB-dependent receptor, partial [Gloeobacteraceae cyanobacterium ES-bin-316]|nr:TonB-dependent receptor [Ferruginibacter sp.]
MKYLKPCYGSFVLFLCLLQFTHAAAQGIFKGKVVDAKSRQPLEMVLVTSANKSNSLALTDEHGNFLLQSVNAVDTLTVSHIGYKTITYLFDKKTPITIELQPDAIRLEDISLRAGAAKFNSLAKIDLALSPVKNTQELFRLMPGLFIAQHAGGGKAEQIFLRGFDVDHGTDVSVSVDGMPVNMVSHAHGQGYADAHFIIPETIQNIDFGAGPYYAQLGNLNTAGYMSFSTYKNVSKSLVQVEAGMFNSYRALAIIDLLKKDKDKQSAYMAGEFFYSDGPTQNKQHFNRFNIFSKYSLALSARTDLTLAASAFKSKWDASGQIPGRAVADETIDRFGSIDPSEGGNTERYNTNLMVTSKLSNGANWENQVYYSRYAFNLFSNFTFFLNDPVNGDGIQQKEQRDIVGFSSQISQRYFLRQISMLSNIGIGLRKDATKESSLSSVFKRKFLSDVNRGDVMETNLFSYISQEASLGKWTLEAGARFDFFHFNYFDRLSNTQLPKVSKSILSPKLNLQYNLNKLVQLYAKAGKGFHSNDTRVITGNNSNQILPAAYGTDLGIMIKPYSNLFVNVAVWQLHLQQEFVYVGDAGIVEPSGKTKRTGIDLIARYQFTKKLFANANFNIT